MRHIALGISLAATSISFATAASAFCGFYVSDSSKNLYNNATQVALMRDGTRTVLSMQNNYEGPPERFAMIVPVPVVLQKENVKTLPRELFAKLEELDAPRLVEYWEQDPCRQIATLGEGMMGRASNAPMTHRLGGAHQDLGVTVEAQFTVGEYEIVILSAEDSGGLDTWLRREKYSIPDGAEPFLRPYVQAGSKFFVAKVDPSKVTFERGSAALSPLRFWYDTEQLTLPIRLGLLNAKDQQDLIVHVLAKGQRYEVANYDNVAIPTNLDLQPSAKDEFASVYDALFDDTVREHPRAIVTEYAWGAGSCDPCPGPSLSMADLATLGADVSPQSHATAGGGSAGLHRYASRGNNYVLTRLHARYSKDTLGDDLVFRAAPPIVGGREMRAFGASLEQTATPSSFNNFQARYAIRHPWTGEIKCEHPVRDVWGGPPDGQASASPRAATKLAFADRSASNLSSFIGYRSNAAPVASAMPAPSASASASPASSNTPSKGACGCELAPSRVPLSLAIFGAALALVGIVRRRRT
jgi:hypothetical protein